MGNRFNLAAILIALLASLSAYANGGFSQQVGYPTLPEIPRQCALITYKDGLETLVVESSYQTDSPSVQWILPIPKKPDKIEVADKDMLTSVSMSLRPNVINDLSRLLNAIIYVFVFSFFFCVLVIFTPKGKSVINRVGLLVFVFLLPTCLVPSLGTRSISANLPDVNILNSTQVGHYTVQVLEPATPSDLNAYLKENGFSPLPDKADGIVKDYINNKWVFLAAKLNSDDKGLRTPHPIAVQFKTANPLFPMRLTSLANTRTQVDLFVVSDQKAWAEGFETQSADQYQHANSGGDGNINYYYASSIRLSLGNPDVQKYLWNNCAVTHLRSNLSPQQMNRDIALAFSPLGNAVQKTFYSGQGRNQASLSALIAGLILPMITGAIVCRRRKKPNRSDRIAILVFGILGLSATPIAFFAHPTIQVTQVERSAMRVFDEQLNLLAKDIKITDLDAVRQEFASKVQAKGILNPYTGQPILESKIPGDYLLELKSGDILLSYFDDDGQKRPLVYFNEITSNSSKH